MEGNETNTENNISSTVNKIIETLQPELEKIDPSNKLLEYRLIGTSTGFQYMHAFSKRYMNNNALTQAANNYSSELENEIKRLKTSSI